MLDYISDPGDKAKARENFDRALSGESFTIIEEYGDSTLSRKYYEDVYNPITDDSGNIRASPFIFRISPNGREGRRNTRGLRSSCMQAQKMESIGRLAGGVAHDFNNMLTMIIGNSEFAMREMEAAPGRENERLYSRLQRILKAARRSADLTRQLLAFASKQTVSPRILDLNEATEGLLVMLRRLIGENISLIWMPGSGIHARVYGSSQADQILTNLCVNARDAIEGTGEIIIENSCFQD
jgi:signal transduction histidine kinase